MIERELPNSPEAEAAVIGGLMRDPSSLAKIADWIAPEDFYQRRHQLIFSSVSALAAAGKPCDAVTMLEHFIEQGSTDAVGGQGYIFDLDASTPGAANIVAYAEIVVERSRLRAAIAEGEALASSALRPGASSSAVISKSVHALSQMETTRIRGGLAPAKSALKPLYQEIVRRYEQGPGLLGLPTPWKALNDITKGLRDGVLYVVGARPSMGKSIFGLNVAAFTALRGARAAFFSVEMTAGECMARAVAAHGLIPFDWVEQPNNADFDSDLYWGRLSQISADLIESPLLIDDTPGLKIDQLMARARRAHIQAPIRLIVIDHMHDMGIDPKLEARHEYGRIAQGGKALAKEFWCPVVMLAQLNRDVTAGHDKRPRLNHLRESGEIEQKADVVMFLHREDYYDTDERKTHLQGVVELIPAKGRNIRIGETVHLKNRFDQMRLDDWEGPLPQAAQTDSERSSGRSGWRRRAA